MSDSSSTVSSSVRAPHAPRRTFLARVAGVLTALPLLSRRALHGQLAPLIEPVVPAGQPNATMLGALGSAVLPSDLGADGTTRAVTDFQRWMDGYRPEAEANHGYGTGRIERLPADPRPRWRTQLAALDSDARRAHSKGFAELTREQRQALVRAATAGERGESLPTPLAAQHVALALLAHFYDSPAATDLCYESEIARQQCRPLASQSEKPVALGRRPR